MDLLPTAPHTCRILAIDGGGIRGLVPATVLASMEKQLGAPLARFFHMVSGTSTGGILAAGLAAEVPATTLVDFYKKRGAAIFSTGFLSNLDGPKYDPAPLEQTLASVFRDQTLSGLKHDLLCPAYDIQARADFLFKSWEARGIQQGDPASMDFPVREVVRATSAAPTYFPPAIAKAEDGTSYPLIDGGMYANNPAMLALVAAKRLMPLAKRYLVVTLGTGQRKSPIPYADASTWGVIGWGTNLLDILFDAMGTTVSYELDQLVDVSQLRLQSDLAGANDALDDATAGNLVALATCGNKVLSDNSAAVAALLAELAQTPLPPAELLGYPAASAPVRPPVLKSLPTLPLRLKAAGDSLRDDVVKPSRWNAGGAVAGALAGLPFGGPLGALIGAAAGYVAGGAVKREVGR